MSEIGEILAQNMKSFRKDRGWTQDDLAEKAALGIDTVRKLETNATWIGKETIEKLAKAFGVTEAVLFRGDRDGPPAAKEVLSIVAEALGIHLPKGAMEKATVSPLTAALSLLKSASATDEKLSAVRAVFFADEHEMVSINASCVAVGRRLAAGKNGQSTG
jgi:transcriptional regulator with XRE-family HTH domain